MSATQMPVARSDRAMSAMVRWLADRGVSLAGARTLTVRGRRSGTPHRIPVNPLTRNGCRYLVSPRGTTDWVRNARAVSGAELRRGRRTEKVVLTEVLDDDVKLPVVRDYLARWGWQVGKLLPEGLAPDAEEATLRQHLAVFPVFEIGRA